jgi:type II secretory pathway pseudopilin PulG
MNGFYCVKKRLTSNFEGVKTFMAMTPIIKKARTGFTLIELAIIISIIGIMAGVAITQFVDLTGSAEEATLKDYLTKLNTGVASFMAAKGYRPTQFSDFAAPKASLNPANGVTVPVLEKSDGTPVCTIAATVLTCDGYRSRKGVYTYASGAITLAVTNKQP